MGKVLLRERITFGRNTESAAASEATGMMAVLLRGGETGRGERMREWGYTHSPGACEGVLLFSPFYRW